VTPDIKKTIADTTIEQSENIHTLDTLTFDWFKFKESVRFLNCGMRIPLEKSKFDQIVSPIFLYEYCAHNGNQSEELRLPNIDSDSKLFEAIVLKSDGEIGMYSDKNEKLLFLHISAKHEQLGALNVVQKTKKEIIAKFGIPDLDTLNNLIYFSRPKVFILHYDDLNSIRTFKYYLQLNSNINPFKDLEKLQW
jgi:hypothetical protein